MNSFKIPKPITSSQKSVRFPDEMIKEIENIIEEENCSFNSFVVECVKYALNNYKG